jgi:HK97 family phage prohead protease
MPRAPTSTSRLRDLLREREAIRSEINKSRRSIGLDPVVVKLSPPRSGSVYLAASPEPRVVEAALGYAKFAGSSSVSLTKDRKGQGRALYERTLATVRAARAARTPEDERLEVMRRLCQLLPNGGGVKLSAPSKLRGAVKLSPIQKFMDGSGTRVLRGFASTSEVDRVGDILVPKGMQARLPVSLLWQHDVKLPIGSVPVAEVRGDGIWIEAPLVTGVAHADEAWALVEGGAVDSFSVGFRSLKTPEPIATGGFRYTSWELLEVSLVSVPANPGAKLRRYM